MSKNDLVHGAIIVISVSIATKVVAFLIEAAVAYYVGTSKDADAYGIVVGFNDVVSPILTIGIWKVFLPIYKKYMTLEGIEAADNFANVSLTYFLTISVGCTVIVAGFADWIISIMAPGLDKETHALSVEMLRITAPFYLFLLAAGIIAAMLQCHNKFLGSQIREIATHIPRLVFAVILFGKLGINGIAVGIAISGLVRLLIQVPFIDWGFKFKFNFNFKAKEFKELRSNLPAAVITAGVLQLNTLLDKIIASMSSSGSISALGYGYKLINVFSGMITTGIATVLYPRTAELAAVGKTTELGQLLEKVMNLICALIIPITIGCMIFSTQIVELVYMRGAFDKSSAQLVGYIFAFYSLGMLFYGLKDILSNVIYAFGNTKTPLVVSILSIALNLVLNLILAKWIGVAGLALATSIAAVVNVIALAVPMHRYVAVNYRVVFFEVIKIMASCIIAFSLPMLFFQNNVSYMLLFVEIVIIIAVYFLCMMIFRSELYNMGLSMLKRVRGNK